MPHYWCFVTGRYTALMRLPPLRDRYKQSPDPEGLATLIRQHLPSLRRIHAVRDAQPRHPKGNSGIPRITMVLSGIRRIHWASGGRMSSHDLEAGEAICVLPSAWSKPGSHPHPHLYLSIDAYPHCTRFMCEACHGAVTPAKAGGFISSGPMPPPARALLQASLSLCEQGAEERLLPVLSCYMQEVLRDCRIDDQLSPAALCWQQASTWAHDHLNEDLGRDQLAAVCGVHPNHVSRLCRRFTGSSLRDWLTSLRMQQAQALLRESDMRIANIARTIGYHDDTHFRKMFKKWSGTTPGRWRNTAQSDHEPA